MRASLLLTLLLLSPLASAKEYVSFFGTALKQKYLPQVEQVCPEGHICMDVVYRWTIKIDKVISGQLTDRTVKAAQIQHSKYIFAHEHQALYVLSRIEDENKRKLLGADYWLEEYAPPATVYCTPAKNDYGLEDNESVIPMSGTKGCYLKRTGF
jgi:hypothetical protein